MKKLLSAILALAIMASMSTVAFAAKIETNNGTDSKDVLAKISDESTKDTVYSIDVTWGEMEFTYKKTGSMLWDSTNHTYTSSTTSEWTATGNEISVTNHSNAAVEATLSFAKDATITDAITGAFDVTTMNLPSAEGKAVNATELTGKSTLTLDGEASTIGENFVKIGTVTVSLS